MTVYFHLKGGKNDFSKTSIRKMTRLIKKYNMKKKAILYMHSTGLLKQFKAYRSYRLGICTGDYNLASLKKTARTARKKYGCRHITIRYYEGINDGRALIDYCHKLGLKVSYYDVVTSGQIQTLRMNGADAWMINRLPD